VTDDPRHARATYVRLDAGGGVLRQGEADAVIGDDGLGVGPVAVSFLDTDSLRAIDYRLELDLWPDGRLELSGLGRRFDTFAAELRRARNRCRVAGLLAHGLTPPETFAGAVLGEDGRRDAELQVYDTHVTLVPEDDDPWQVPLGSLTAVRARDGPAAVVLASPDGDTVVGRLARRRDAFEQAVAARWALQAQTLARVTGQAGFADGMGVPRGRVAGWHELVERYTASERAGGATALLAAATAEARLGFVQLLDLEGDVLAPRTALPEPWASFLLVPVRGLTVLEMLAGPSAATYVFHAGIEDVNRDLQALHFRRGPLALTPQQAEITPANPHRLALRRLEPLRRLRERTTARIVHTDGWSAALNRALTPSTP